MPYNIGIDIGTSSVKVLAVNEAGDTLALERGDYPILTPRPGYREQNPDEIFRACLDTLSRVRRQFSGPPSAIGLSSAMHSVIALDPKGKPLTHAILWADTRSQGLAEALRASGEGRRIYEATGTPIHALSPLLKIRWLGIHERERFERSARFADIKTYIIFRLTGEWLTDYSMASASGLLNIHVRDWNRDSLAYAGISPDQLPRLVDTSCRLPKLQPTIAAQLEIPQSVPWIIGASDGCLANLGSFVFDRHSLALSTGTSAALRYTASRPALHYEGQTFCYYLDRERQIVGGASNNGGMVLNWFRERFYPGESMAHLLRDAGSVEAGANSLIFLPWLLGERAPIWDTRASGVFVGIRETHGRPHFARAVMEGIAYNLYRIFEDIRAGDPWEIRRIISSGGLSRSPQWNQLLADVFNLPVLTIQETESSALGAIMLALKATGQVSDYAELESWQKNGQTYTPQSANHERYRHAMPIAFGLYRQLQPAFRSLTGLAQEGEAAEE